MMKWIGFLFLLLNSFHSAVSQSRYRGKIYNINGYEIIPEANIRNLSNGRFANSDQGGNFSISATVKDIIIFSSAGYLADTVILKDSDLITVRRITLRPKVQLLADVEVDQMAKYEEDSIKRHTDYAVLLEKKHPVKLMNEKRPGDDPGFSFSPLGFFSKTEKQKRELKKRIREEDEDEYIDVKFSKTQVVKLTRLSGDSLRQFMYIYRPGYTFCRKASNKDMFLYINDKFILFKKQKSKKT